MSNKSIGTDTITEYLTWKMGQLGVPVSGTFELTPQCNMNCKMCYVRKNKEEILQSGHRERTADEWIAMAKECKDAGMLYILITGGEPFFYPEFWKVYTAIHKMGFIISLNTNGTMLTTENLEKLKQYPPNRINVTVYGASEETYNRLCGNPTGFTRMSKAVAEMQAAGMMVRLNCTVTKYNMTDQERIYEFADKQHLEVHMGTYIFPAVRKSEGNIGGNDRMTPEEAAFCEHMDMEHNLSTKEKIERKRAIREGCEVLNTQKREECSRDFGAPLACRAGRSTFWINWKGEMTACGMMNHPSEKPFESGFANAWEKIKASTAQMRMPVKCHSCEKKFFCHVCGAVCYTETGHVDGVPEYVCRMTEEIKRLTLENEV